MNKLYEELQTKALSAFRALSRDYAPFEDARMLLGSAETQVSLERSKINKTIDTEWIDKIEAAIPAIDIIVRNPSVAIEDVDEILPVELSRHITEKSIKHLAQHTNLILDIKDDEVTPSKILNVFHEETHLTYENKFVNTLLSRLSAFVDKRLRVLNGGSGIEMDYKFDYSTEFEHLVADEGGRNSARVHLIIEMTSPLGREMTGPDLEINERYIEALNRLKRINMALVSFRSSAFAQKLGKNYIRPPVIRTNAILKNKNLKECLNLWEYIESYDKVGYSFIGDKYYELPSADFVGGMYSSAALQYLTLYTGIGDELKNSRLISEKHLFETMPEFDDDIMNEELDDYLVYDSEYKKTVPVSRLMNNRKKLSEDEKKIREAILVALKADDIINEEILRAEEEKRRIAREKRLAEEEAARKLAEAAAKQDVEIRYKRSFLSRYIQAESYIQDYYTEIKNELLSYKGVKSKISWSKETFKRGRIPVARMDVKGKTLYLYLALDGAKLEGTKYRYTDVSGKSVGRDFPVLLKVNSERKKKYALEVIAMLMAELELVKIEREAEDYHMPYEETEALIERGLIKVILPKGQTLDENTVAVKADFSGIVRKTETVELESIAAFSEAVEEAPEVNVAEPVMQDTDSSVNAEEVEAEELTEPESAEATAEQTEAAETLAEDGEKTDGEAQNVSETKPKTSVFERFIRAREFVQYCSDEIKSKFLSYDGVERKASWGRDVFVRDGSNIARVDARLATVYLYLAINPARLSGTKYNYTDVSGKGVGKEYPVLLILDGASAMSDAVELIEMLME